MARSMAMSGTQAGTAWPAAPRSHEGSLRIGPRSRACSSGMRGTFSGPSTRLPTTTWRSTAASSNWTRKSSSIVLPKRTATNLEQALLCREVIGLAQGILIERECITPEQAANVLRRGIEHINENHNTGQNLADPAKDPGTAPAAARPRSTLSSRSGSSLDHAYGALRSLVGVG